MRGGDARSDPTPHKMGRMKGVLRLELTYFLGANSFGGFASLYEDLTASPDVSRLYILKGGAGCGKSSFMKRIADAAAERGLSVERVLCSGDPSSLDGVFIPALRLAYVDGTAPHAAVPTADGGGYSRLKRERGGPSPLTITPAE